MKYTSKEFRVYMKDGRVHLECEGRKCLVVDHTESESQARLEDTDLTQFISPLGTVCAAVA